MVSLENLKGWQSRVITVSDKQDTLSSRDQEHVQPSSPGTDSVLCHVSKLGHVGNWNVSLDEDLALCGSTLIPLFPACGRHSNIKYSALVGIVPSLALSFLAIRSSWIYSNLLGLFPPQKETVKSPSKD